MPREVIQELSPREDEILRLAAEGYTDAGISHKLGISEGTVGTYWGRIRTKIGPHPRTELIAIRLRAEMQKELDVLGETRETLERLLQESVNSELLYEDIIDQAPEGLVVVNAEGAIEHANPAAHRFFRCEPGTLRLKPLADLMPEELRGRHRAKFEAFCRSKPEGPKTFRLETTAVDRFGEEFPVIITVTTVHRGDELLLTGLFQRPASQRDGKFRISVGQLQELGLANAATLDRDQDGWVDEDEFEEALAALRRSFHGLATSS